MTGNFLTVVLSGNTKIGTNCAVTTSPIQTCPECALMDNGCYAQNFPLDRVWKRISEGEWGEPWEAHLKSIRQLPMGRFLRVNQAGDFPPSEDRTQVDRQKCLDLAKASGARSKTAWAYTHYLPEGNTEVFQEMTDHGLTVNLSANSPAQALEFMESGLPVTTIAKEDFKSQVIDGVRFVVCPAVGNKHLTCSGGCVKHDYGNKDKEGKSKAKYYQTYPCGGGKVPLCAKKERDYVIVFPAHGSRRRKAESVVESFEAFAV